MNRRRINFDVQQDQKGYVVNARDSSTGATVDKIMGGNNMSDAQMVAEKLTLAHEGYYDNRARKLAEMIRHSKMKQVNNIL